MEDQRMLPVKANDYDHLDELRKANNWSVEEAAHRAIRAISALDQQLQALADRHEGEVGALIGRLRRELDPKFLVCPKSMRQVESECDLPIRIRVDDILWGATDRALIGSRIVGNQIEHYVVQDGLTYHGSGPFSGEDHPEGVWLT